LFTDLIPKKANTLDEAVGQYYDNPDKYSHATTKQDEKPQARYNMPLPPVTTNGTARRAHMNVLIEAENIRARDEQQMQNLLQTVQLNFGIYNPEI
jgi:hypothetical protein